MYDLLIINFSIMETKDLFLKFSRIYQSCTLLENLQAAYAMHDLSSCRELTAFYKKLTGDKKSDELYFWCDEDNRECLKLTIEEEQKKICTLFKETCNEMSSRFEIGTEAWDGEVLKVFSRVFFCLARNLCQSPVLHRLAEISESFLAKNNPEFRENFSEIFREMMSDYSMGAYIHELVEIFESRGYSDEKQSDLLSIFGVNAVKITLDLSDGDEDC